MQTPTHLRTGVLIDQAVPDIKPGYIRSLVIAFLGIYSHAILDALSALTYHPPDPFPEDRFWLGYHAGVAALTLKVWLKNQHLHKWAMICSMLPDLDWVFIKIPTFWGRKASSSKRPILHELLFKSLYSLPLLSMLRRLPDLRQKKAAVAMEIIFYALLTSLRK